MRSPLSWGQVPMSDGVVLLGLPGSGKTSVGKHVAAALGKPFVDIDDEILRATGRSAAEILSTDGEPRFREVERAAVSAACAVDGAVIATGGGSGLDPLNRWQLAEHGVRVRLDAPVEQLAGRVEADPGLRRPLLGGALLDGLAASATARASTYAAFDTRVDASAAIVTVVDAVLTAVQATNLARWRTLYDGTYQRHHQMGPREGRYVAGVGLDRDSLDEFLASIGGQRPIAVVDLRATAANPALSSALANVRSCAVDGGEDVKTFGRLEELLRWVSETGAERRDALIAVGGGTIGDVAGLAAALFQRGMPLVNIPTTWLAQADSALGGKVAIDLPEAKNAVGAFWPAWLTISDAQLVESLPLERRRDGIAECLKMGLIGDRALWALVETRGADAVQHRDPGATFAMTERAARLKLEIVDHDPYESGERRKLNLGHTIGHALEIESRYTLAHGGAVALGLRAVAAISHRQGAEPSLAERIDDVLSRLGFPLTRTFDRAEVVAALSTDKKRISGRQRWILPMAVGEVIEVDDVTDKDVMSALDVIRA